MNISFKAKTNKKSCMVNIAKFHLKKGGTITIDRDASFYSITDGILEMEWSSPYLWEVNGVTLFDKPTIYFSDSDNLSQLLDGAWVELELEDDADDDYYVIDIVWNVTDVNGSVSGIGISK